MAGKILKSVTLLALIGAPFFVYAQEPTDERENNASQNEAGKRFNFVTITGQEVREKDFKLGPGMEVITVRGVNVVAPKGTRVEDKGSWIKVEEVGEFLGRRFDEIQARLEQVEKQQALLLQELEKIKESLEETNRQSSASP